MKTFNERFEEWFDEQTEGTRVHVYNYYAEYAGHEEIFHMHDFNEFLAGFDPFRVACMAHFGTFDPSCDWFTFDGGGNIETIYRPSTWLEDYVLDMADWYAENQSKLVDAIGGDTYRFYGDEIEEDEEDEL